jgi:hypothetical protein
MKSGLVPKKFLAKPDPLEQEDGVEMLAPPPEWSKQRMKEFVQDRIEYGQKIDDPDYVKPFKVKLAQLEEKEMKKNIAVEYVREFDCWLNGTSKYNTKDATPWGKKRLVGSTIDAYREQFIVQRGEFRRKMAALRLDIPNDISDAWLYFRFIVVPTYHGVKDEQYFDFLENSFLEEYASFFRQDHKNSKITVEETVRVDTDKNSTLEIVKKRVPLEEAMDNFNAQKNKEQTEDPRTQEEQLRPGPICNTFLNSELPRDQGGKFKTQRDLELLKLDENRLIDTSITNEGIRKREQQILSESTKSLESKPTEKKSKKTVSSSSRGPSTSSPSRGPSTSSSSRGPSTSSSSSSSSEEATRKIKESEEKVKTLEAKLSESENRIVGMMRNIEEKESINNNLEKSLKQLQLTSQSLQKKLTLKETEHETLSIDLQEKQKQITQLKSSIEDLKNVKTKESEASIQQKMEEVEKNRKEAELMFETITKLQNEIVKEKREKTEISNKKEQLEADLQSSKETVQEQKKKNTSHERIVSTNECSENNSDKYVGICE